MTVKIRYLNRKGDEERQVSVEEAQRLIDLEKGRYICFNTETHKMISKFEIQDNQTLALIPIIRGG